MVRFMQINEEFYANRRSNLATATLCSSTGKYKNVYLGHIAPGKSSFTERRFEHKSTNSRPVVMHYSYWPSNKQLCFKLYESSRMPSQIRKQLCYFLMEYIAGRTLHAN